MLLDVLQTDLQLLYISSYLKESWIHINQIKDFIFIKGITFLNRIWKYLFFMATDF